MQVDPPFNVYRDQLTSLYHGIALWNPSPLKDIYEQVSIGDVGYVRDGVFIRMFNVVLPWDHESNRTLGEPEPYESLDCGPFSKALEVPFKKQQYYSRNVSTETNGSNTQATSEDPDDAKGVTYNCRGHGALLFLPHGGHRLDIIQTKGFEDYIRDHVVSWFTWAQKNKHGIERIEDLVLVSGCTLVPSWAAAAFVDSTMEAKVSLARRTLGNAAGCFVWDNIKGAVEYNDNAINPQNPTKTPDQCVFIRGFRAKRVWFWTTSMRAAAEPRPDDPDNRRDDEFQVTRFPDGSKYRDPVMAILDYIVEKCSKDAKIEDGTIAIAHDEDLRLIKDVEILTADAVEGFLREKQIPVLVENGTATLRDGTTTSSSTSPMIPTTSSFGPPLPRVPSPLGSPRIQLPSIFSIEDPFSGEHRRAHLPTLSSELSFRGRLPSVNPATRGLAYTPAPSYYEFPERKPAPDIFIERAPLPDLSSGSSGTATTSLSTSPLIPTTSSFGSPLPRVPSPLVGSPRIQLPSIFSIEDPFRGEHRRAPLPTLSSELSSRGRLPSVNPASRALASAVRMPPSLSYYQFPPSSIDSDDKSTIRPKLTADSQFGLPFPEHAPLPGLSYGSSATATTSSLPSSPTTSSFGFLPTTGYTPGRAQLPSLQFSDSEPWGTATDQNAPLPGIVRPNSTPGPIHSSSEPFKNDDDFRHLLSLLSGSPTNQAPMYEDVARISDQTERRASYTQSSTSEAAKEEWNISTPDNLLPSASANKPVHSRSRTPPAPPAPSSLVDRPRRRGKLPKPTTDFLKDWLHRHSDHPYPSEDERKQLCAATGLSMSQVSNWMINARRQILAPIHRPRSGPAIDDPLSSQRGHSGVSTGTLLRQASMPTDSLQLYDPSSLQSISHAGSGPPSADPPYTFGNYTQQSSGIGSGIPASMSLHHQPYQIDSELDPPDGS